MVGILSVAVEAVFRKNGADLSIEVHFGQSRVGNCEGAYGEAEEHLWENERSEHFNKVLQGTLGVLNGGL